MRTNLMKAKLLAGKPVFGVTLMFPAPQIVEMLGSLGFDKENPPQATPFQWQWSGGFLVLGLEPGFRSCWAEKEEMY